jgi:hypothetical protein
MNRMAGGTNGLDLSETLIIMDYFVIKNSSFMHLVLQTHKHCRMSLAQEYRSGC